MNQKNELIKIEHLTKKYQKKQALTDINLTLESGHIVGLLGPNGSGKTSLIKILTGVIRDYSGNITIDGNKIGPSTKAIISYLPDHSYFSKWMRPLDVISIFKDFYADFDEAKCLEMVLRLGLNPKQKLIQMSKGMIERFQLCLVMSRKARLYILDEPLGGIDPASRDFILDTILTNYNEDATILMSTHLISDVERIFDTIIFIKDGEIVLNDDIDNIRSSKGKSIDQLFREVFKC